MFVRFTMLNECALLLESRDICVVEENEWKTTGKLPSTKIIAHVGNSYLEWHVKEPFETVVAELAKAPDSDPEWGMKVMSYVLKKEDPQLVVKGAP